MAFVFRAERKINLQDNEKNNAYPGEYYKESSLIKYIDKQNSVFQSVSSKSLINDPNKISDTPGPGSYEKNILYYDEMAFLNKEKKTKNNDIYQAVKANLMSKEILKFLEKSQNIAFNTRGGRFNYSIEDLEKKSKLPGPGSYSPNKSSIINNSESTAANNNSSKISSKESKIHQLEKGFPSDYRKETIPSKGILGYDFDKDGNQKILVSSENQVKNRRKSESVGPGQYNIGKKWEKNVVSWSRTRDEKDPKYDLIKFRKNLSPLSQLEQDFLDNKSIRIGSSRNKKNNDKNAVFKYVMNLRYDTMKNIKAKKDYESDPIFDSTPGPGYYAPLTIGGNEENNNYSKRKDGSFLSESPRFGIKTLNNSNNNLGPGFYYELSKPLVVKKPKLASSPIANKKGKNIPVSALDLSLHKENYKVPGPGSYEVRGSLLHIPLSENHNFGINSKRFKEDDTLIDSPGPGSYNYKDLFKKEKYTLAKNDYHNKIITNSKLDLANVKESNKIIREKFSVPPIGLYNPSIISTMDYNVKSKINEYLDNKLVGFGSQEKRNFSFSKKGENKYLGPGIYYKNCPKNLRQNKAPFNENNQRFNYIQNEVPGPGSYDVSNIDEWNKKSHNILFV